MLASDCWSITASPLLGMSFQSPRWQVAEASSDKCRQRGKWPEAMGPHRISPWEAGEMRVEGAGCGAAQGPRSQEERVVGALSGEGRIPQALQSRLCRWLRV